MQNKNIVLFSSGISEKSGILGALSDALTERGYICEYWRDLFSSARDEHNIALLPMLIKKIPTFDYAVLVCEGHDTTVLKRNDAEETVSTMRDNVLFEIGLCVMALGAERTILVTDESVRLPDDLTGLNNETALKRIVYSSDGGASANRDGDIPACQLDEMAAASEEISRYIESAGKTLSPVVIGAASSTACGYVNNFVFRILEHIDEGVLFEGETERRFYPDEKIFVHIVLPGELECDTVRDARGYMERYRAACVPSARSRPADFRCEIRGDELHIVDFPTTLVTSYDTAGMILSLEADDTADPRAAARFTAKELNLYEATLEKLLCEKYLSKVLHEQYGGLDEKTLAHMKGRISDIISNRLTVERFG